MRNINEAMLQSIYDNDDKLRDIIATELDIDCPWLVDAIADVLSNRLGAGQDVAAALLVRAIERHLKPAIEQAARDEVERLEEV
jgi:hypothetical protein